MFNILLFSCEAHPSGYDPWPFASPETKRTEVYYALAGGAKGIGYWWFKPSSASNGLGDQADPRAQVLWKEIGLLGAEIKTLTPYLATACPVDLDVQGSTNVWVRGLARGDDTLFLVVVNDDHWNDQDWHSNDVTNATVTVALPDWMQSPAPTAFEVSAAGLGDVATQLNGGQLQVSLGTLEVTRMIVVTTNPTLRATIQQRYEQEVWPGVCNFAPEYCTPQEDPPSITQHPQSHSVCAGSTTTFTVGATGSGLLAYRWQKNQVDLSDDGHHSGVTTNTLMITTVEAADAASYRCVVSNAYGSVNSNEAALTVLACEPGCLQNLGFEEGFTAGVGTGWIKFSRVGDVTCSEETAEHHGGSYCQEVYSHDDENDGGVYQQFIAVPGEQYTVKAWFKCYSPQGSDIGEGWLGVDPYGGTDPNSANVWWGSKPYEYWSQKAWTGTAQGSVITVYLRGRSTKAPSQNKTAYVWIDDVELALGAPTDSTPQIVGPTGIRWQWIDSAGETGYRVRDTGGVDKSGLLPADTTQWLETTGIAPNTQYTRHIHALDDCGESDPSAGQTARTLSVPPEAGSVTPSTSDPGVGEDVVWTAAGGFGAGTLQYYRYAWDQSSTHAWTGAELQWSSGTLTTSPTAPGTWYLHVQGYNADDIVNGTYDYNVNAGGVVIVAADFDGDGDVDQVDFGHFQACLTGSAVPITDPNCQDANFDGDTDVDQNDFSVFQACLSGAGIPADPGCDNPE